MQHSDKPAFLSAMNALASAFRVEASEALLDGYWMALDDLPLDAVMTAVRSAMRTHEQMPRPVELRRLTGEMTTAARSVHAWSSLTRAIGQHGAYASVDFDDPVLNATVRNLGGWVRLCQLDAEEFEKWTRKDFERIYSALCASGVPAEQTKHLVGIHEQNNVGKGFELKAPAKVATGLPPHREGILRGAIEAPEAVRQLVAGAAR